MMLRHSYLWIDVGSRRKMDKLQLSSKDLFNETESLLNEYVRRHSSKDISLEGEKTQLQQLFETLVQKAGDIDKSLLGAVEGEKTKMLNGLDNLAAKFLRAEKRRHDESSQQIRQLKEKLFPNQSLQERTDSLIQYYAQYGATFIENCYQLTKAHNEAFVVVAMQ
ncbi:MAG: bacillithiol biosynthesis BshC [Sphingobacteriales bacterium]|nr:bacillithiol biosynthesis BshC [Sphingobacteriales bacterium]